MSSRRTRSRTLTNRRTRRGAENSDGACIDLTLDVSGDQIIDLTQMNNLIDMSVVVLSPLDGQASSTRRRQRGSGRRGLRRSRSSSRRSNLESPYPPPSRRLHLTSSPSEPSSSSHVRVESSDEEELPDIPFEVSESSTKANASFIASPPLSISCPVCLDDLKQIKSSKKRIISTVCGHIFCEECINNAIQSFKKCPTCRKSLTKAKTHPLFL